MINKKKLGIIGGMGSRAGAYFLRKVIDYSPAESDQEFIEILFHNNSAIPDRTRAIAYGEASPLPELLRSVELFGNEQVEVIAMGCITAYYYYDQICLATGAKVLNPLHLVAGHLREAFPFARRVGVLATTGTLRSGLFHQALANAGVELITLDRDSQESWFMRSVYMKNGYKSARISDEARMLMDRCVGWMERQQVDVVIGGCTEVSIALDANTLALPFIDMLDLMARKAVDYCYNLNHILKTEYNG